MILKTRGASVKKERLEVLLRRLPKWHDLYKIAKEYFYADAAGMGGEQRFDHYINMSTIHFPHFILHNLQLKSLLEFQLDSLIITPWCIFVFEVKNIAGRLQFKDAPPQLIQTKEDGTVIGRKSPLEQMATNEWLLEEWLRTRNFFLPIRSVLVLAYPKQMPEDLPDNQTTLFAHQLPMFLNKINQQEAEINSGEINELAYGFYDAHINYVPKPICANPSYPLEIMLKGVWCKECDEIGMKRSHGGWHCSKCSARDANAHIQTIKDWILLTGEPLSNKVCREVLQIDDRHVVKRLLQEMSMQKLGTFKDAKYVFERKCSYFVGIRSYSP